jgi:hypothetical protein
MNKHINKNLKDDIKNEERDELKYIRDTKIEKDNKKDLENSFSDLKFKQKECMYKKNQLNNKIEPFNKPVNLFKGYEKVKNRLD